MFRARLLTTPLIGLWKLGFDKLNQRTKDMPNLRAGALG